MTHSQVLIIGSSIAGLLAATVVRKHFDKVIIVERDRLPEQSQARKGVPQHRHPHVLLAKGQHILNELFPGFSKDLLSAGGIKIDWYNDFAWHTPAGWAPRFPSQLITPVCSRIMVEWLILQRVKQFQNVEFREETIVQDLIFDQYLSKVQGAKLSRKDQPDFSEELRVDMIIDASGRGSKLPETLEKNGFQPPRETVVNPYLGYATRWYKIPQKLHDWKMMLIWNDPPEQPRSGTIVPIEKDRWIVGLMGADKDYPQTNETQFLEFAKSLNQPDIYHAIKEAEPLTNIFGFRSTANRLRHYHNMKDWPERLIVIGDAVGAFNPIYAQGIASSCLAAMLLKNFLGESTFRTKNFASNFQKQLYQQFLKTLWLLTTNEDFRWTSTEGRQMGLKNRFMHWYVDRVRLLSIQNKSLHQLHMEVLHLLQSPHVLFHPTVLFNVLKG